MIGRCGGDSIQQRLVALDDHQVVAAGLR